MKNLHGIIGRTVVAMMFVVATPAWAQSPQSSTAQSLFIEGKEAADSGRWEKAAKLLAQSFQLEQAPKTAGWLGRALVESGDFVVGANYLEFFLHEEKQPSGMKEAAEEMLIDIKPKIATVTLEMNPPHAEAFVDGNRIEDKRLTWPIHVSPTEHSFEFKQDGYVPRTVRGKYAAGESKVIQVKLEPVVEKKDDGQNGKPGNASGLAPEAKVGYAIAGGLAAVAVGTGIGALATYGPTSDAFVAKNRNKYEEQRGMLQGFSWTMTVSGALAVSALVYAVTRPRNGQSSNSSATVGLMVTPSVGGMAISGVW